MNHEAARNYIKQHGPLPEQPPLESRTCAHASAPRPCSCHLSLEQQAVAEELGNYTLYVFGAPYRGRLKVPFYPAGGVSFEEYHVHSAADLEHLARLGGPLRNPVAAVASTTEQVHVAPTEPSPSSGTSRPKRAFDPVYNAAYAKARRRGPEAVAAFKAEWAAKRAAA